MKKETRETKGGYDDSGYSRSQSATTIRRMKRMFLDEVFLLKVITGWHTGSWMEYKEGDLIRLPSSDLPKDTTILSAQFRLGYMQFEFLLWSKEWPVIPAGQLIPEIRPTYTDLIILEGFKIERPRS